MTAAYPRPEEFPSAGPSLEEVAILQDGIRAVRRIRAEMQIAPKIELRVNCESPALWLRHMQALRDLCGVVSVHEMGREGICVTAIVRGQPLYIPLEGVIDIGEEIQRLNKELARSEKDISSLEKRLGNPGFTDRAPPQVVEEFATKLDSARDRWARLSEARALLAGAGEGA
jgi:valyl-tRNA synthetase